MHKHCFCHDFDIFFYMDYLLGTSNSLQGLKVCIKSHLIHFELVNNADLPNDASNIQTNYILLEVKF